MRCGTHAARGAHGAAEFGRPDQAYSVFAGQETEATDRARSYFTGYPPSSPSIGILRDGQLSYLMPRSDIERASSGDRRGFKGGAG